MGGLGPQESVPTERKKPQVRMILNSALMSHNAGAISHQNPCGSEVEVKDKTKGRCLFVLIFMGGAGDKKHVNAHEVNEVCYIEAPSTRYMFVCGGVGWRGLLVQMENLGEVPLR